MATLTFKGLQEYELQISRVFRNTEKICGQATYAGAKIVADEMKKRIEALPVITGYGSPENPLPGGVTAVQKRGLIDGFGISGLQNDNGFHNVKLGFDGYNATKTEDYPNGQPNQLVARGVESGTSWKQKKPFIRPAINASRKEAEKKMAEVIDAEIQKLME